MLATFIVGGIFLVGLFTVLGWLKSLWNIVKAFATGKTKPKRKIAGFNVSEETEEIESAQIEMEELPGRSDLQYRERFGIN